MPRDGSDTLDPYVKLYLLPDPKKASKQKTKIARKTLNPTYNQMVIDISLGNRSLPSLSPFPLSLSLPPPLSLSLPPFLPLSLSISLSLYLPSPSPSQFYYSIKSDSLTDHCLQLSVWDASSLLSKECLGCVLIELTNKELSTWFELEPASLIQR